MFTLKVLSIINFIFLLGCSQPNGDAIDNNVVAYSANTVTNDSLLLNIQDKIQGAFQQSVVSGSDASLIELEDQLKNSKNQSTTDYWLAYLGYHHSIFHLVQENEKESEKTSDDTIDLLENKENKNAEDYALLAMVQGFSIQFKGFRAMFISKSIKNNANHAIKLDSTNNRAYYVLGNNDYYTPEKFGGGKKVEEYIFKSLSLPTQKAPNPYLPSWGREEAYEILIRHYIYEKNAAEAKKYFKIASEEFPDNYQLKELATKLVSMD